MRGSRVVVVGGGLAGITAALDLADAGAAVTLLEGRPRLGGATWSTLHRGLWIDNGQHVFLRCCEAYRGLLARLGVEDRVELQAGLDVPVLRPGARAAHLRRDPLPAPLHLARSLLGFRHLGLGERLAVARAARKLAKVDRRGAEADRLSFGAWLARQGQSPASIDRFWDLIVRPTLNLPAEEASLALAAKVFQTGLLADPAAADIGWARTPLASVHGEPGARALEKAGVGLRLRTRVKGIEPRGQGGFRVALADGTLDAEAVVLATDHRDASRLAPAAAQVDRAALGALGAAPIVNLHVVYDRPVVPQPMVAVIDSPLQWIFDRSEGSGLDHGQYLAVSLSAADSYVGVSGAEMWERFGPEFERVFPRAREARVIDFFVTCERVATFRQAPGCERLRPGPRTALPGFYLAGAWTDTGWPATMEGAVLSGHAAARAAIGAAPGA